MSSYSPLFVTNTARSGSYLISMLMSTNSNIMVASEPYLELFRSLRNALIQHNAPTELQTKFSPSSPMQDYYFNEDRIKLMNVIQESNLDIPYDETEWADFLETSLSRVALQCAELQPYLHKIKGNTYKEMFDHALNIIADARNCHERKWVGIKDAWTIEFFTPIARAYPEGKFIIILRDPRAIINSMLGIVSIDSSQVAHVISYARHWRKYAAFTYHYMQNPLIKDRLYVLSHEQVLREPEKKAREICKFLDVDFEPGMLDTNNYIDYATGDIWKGNSSFETTTAGISTHRAERWKSKLDPKVTKVIEFLCAPEMQMLGYELVNDNPYDDIDYEVLNYVIETDKAYANWRSDLQDPQQDYGFEIFRHSLLHSPSSRVFETNLLKRSFLFSEVFEKLREKPTIPII